MTEATPWDHIEDAVKNAPSSAAAVKFNKRSSGGVSYEYAVVELRPGVNKLVVHVLNVGPRLRETIAAALYRCVDGLGLPPGAHADAGDNPIYKGNWDLVVYGVPGLRTKYVVDSVLRTLESVLS